MLMTLINKNLSDQIVLQFIKLLISCKLPEYGQCKNPTTNKTLSLNHLMQGLKERRAFDKDVARTRLANSTAAIKDAESKRRK